ncbi:SusC/RagA family TonB-linked outer membrane protein [Sphingobacterium griseoflavum]|uniref:SusC/RagA family TonB-linked outer membrane protein n=1 Tax=Sphingobacterium griseoflavum TaxID=1474952 RepID=A0ABQ3HY50_9SPHI|nr:TonB-dependent receptor [Sphingobacterium griseoflavum]GHE45190.1 SusC/RagA family TonB-linked outer membrane protein [Sphingobacterium griseoflavum]
MIHRKKSPKWPLGLLRYLPFLFFTFGLIHSADAQRVKVSGVVKDASQALIGVTVVVEGSSLSTTTDSTGSYLLNVPAGSTLKFFHIGHQSSQLSLQNYVPLSSGEYRIDVVMESQNNDIDEVTVVAFGTQRKSSMVSAIETVSPKELKVPSSNLTTALAGRIAGVIAYQRSGEPGQDNASFFIRGVTTFGYKVDPLILIDNVEVSATELARMQPDDIESFSIMKDATATALYGARGANGVILITTKAGKEGPAKISFRAENSFSSPTKNIKLADPVTYMQLANESVLTRNPLGSLPYAQNKIDQTAAGANEYIYPAVDWMDALLRDYTTNQRYNFSASGGGQVARYYIAGTMNQDNGILKVDKRNNFNSNINLKSYQLRSNINLNMTKSTEVIVRLSGSFDDYRGPIDGGSGMYTKIMRSSPVDFPAFFPAELMPRTNHILFGNVEGASLINPYADMVKGYKDYSKSLMNAQFELKQDLGALTEGLSLRGLFNTSRYSFFDLNRNYNPFYYRATGYNAINDTYALALLNENSATEYLNYNEGAKDINTTVYMEGAVNYINTFGKHDVSGLLVYIRRQQLFANQGTLQRSLPYRNQGLSGRFTYGYDNRYMLEANFGYNGSERFYETERYGFFPAAGAGWYISNERFWEPLSKIVTKLKLRATYGMVGNDAIGGADDRFFYLSEVNMNDDGRGAVFGERFNYYRPGITVNRYDNRLITWERSTKLNTGFEFGLFNAFELQVDYFNETRDNILMNRAAIPTTMGLSADVRANVGRAKAYGVDLSADFNKSFGELWLQMRGNFTYARSEFLEYEEPEYAEQYKLRPGNSINQVFGLVAERLFVDEFEVANAPRQNYGDYMAGDIKYRDLNMDGRITDLDQVPIGYPTVPEIIYGFGFSTGMKGFDLSVFMQGSARSSFWIDPRATAPFVSYNYPGESLAGTQNALLEAYANDHWSESNRNLYALWPRLSNAVNNNNGQTSTWFMRNGAFLRLKTVEFGYSIPQKVLKNVKLGMARAYLSGINLANITGFKLWDIEMGGNGLGYPVQRVFNLGLQIGF